ncbi:hypothetical protein SUDANB51_02941 [Streptomyces sp. enrichment culture]
MKSLAIRGTAMKNPARAAGEITFNVLTPVLTGCDWRW